MIRSLLFLLFSVSAVVCCAQDSDKGFRLISLSVGPNFSNLLGSEAPHKINIVGSDQNPGVLPAMDVKQSIGYFDYETSMIKDILTGIAIRLGTEYRVNNQWYVYAAIGYEEKGIHLKSFRRESRSVDLIDNGDDNAGNRMQQPASGIVNHDEYLEVEIRNAYLTLPVMARRYLRGERFYIQGGIYAGWLLTSQIRTFQRKHTYTVDQTSIGTDFQFSRDFTDDDKEFTTRFDPGFSLGCGLDIPLSGKLLFNADLLLNAGVRKVDRKYNNEYSEEPIPYTDGVVLLVRSTNYFGLNSKATNISASLTAGLSYSLQ